MSTYELIETIEISVEKHINKYYEQVSSGRENIGLDPRCGIIYISEDAIAVPQYNDRTVQYYGGFEYVDKEFRKEMGNYVFYLADDERVLGHIQRFFESKEKVA